MSLFINSPSYYTANHGIDEEIYKMCKLIEKNVDVKTYTSQLDTIGITPIIAPKEEICDGKFKEVKLVNISYRFASISLQLHYQTYVSADMTEKKLLIINNVLMSLSLIN